MYGLNRLNSATPLRRHCRRRGPRPASLYTKQSLLLNSLPVSISFTHSSDHRAMDPPSPSATTGVYDFFNDGEGGAIPGEEKVDIPENESSNNDSHNTYERRVLPPELSKNVTMLVCESAADGGVCEVYVVGTCHVSTESCQEVEGVIDFLKPEVVFLELCSSRVHLLRPHNIKVPTMGEMVEMWKNNQNLFGILCRWFHAKVSSQLEVRSGAEFCVAYEVAMRYGGKVILGDRPIQITVRRTWTKMPLWHKTKFVFAVLFQAMFWRSPENLAKSLKEIDDVDMQPLVIQEMSKNFPTVMETLVNERDVYMSAGLLKLAREHNSVVAVVGKGHVAGIKKNWQQPVEPVQLRELLEMPAEKSRIGMGKIVTSIGATVAGVAIIFGIYLSLKK